MILRGLTWDHPRGYVVLDALNTGPAGLNTGPAGLNTGPVRWERQSLEGFESCPLRDLADDFDLLIIDHPGLGEAVRDHALRPMEEIFSDAELSACEAVSAGRSFASYRFGGSQWALPVDAAAQVSVSRPDLMADRPATWDEVRQAAQRHRTAVCLGGPHALLMFAAICVSLGAPPASLSPASLSPASLSPASLSPASLSPAGASLEPAAAVWSADQTADPPFADHAAGSQALDIMAELLARADPALARRNPIAVLDAMAAGDGPAYCPLVYGYISYQREGQSPAGPHGDALTAFDAPAGPAGIGSVLGGTGIAVTRSCTRPDLAGDYLRHLLSEETQVGTYAEVGGQSADWRAWLDPEADEKARGFYAATRRTVAAAWVRPRFAGYPEFQAGASAILRDGLINGENPDRSLDRVNELFACSKKSIAPAQRGTCTSSRGIYTATTRRQG